MAGDSQAPGTPPAKDTPLNRAVRGSLSSRPIFTESESNVDGARRPRYPRVADALASERVHR
jgi:hypothetical protein